MSASDCLPRKISSSIDQDGAYSGGLAKAGQIIEFFPHKRTQGLKAGATEPGNPTVASMVGWLAAEKIYSWGGDN